MSEKQSLQQLQISFTLSTIKQSKNGCEYPRPETGFEALS